MDSVLTSCKVSAAGSGRRVARELRRVFCRGAGRLHKAVTRRGRAATAGSRETSIRKYWLYAHGLVHHPDEIICTPSIRIPEFIGERSVSSNLRMHPRPNSSRCTWNSLVLALPHRSMRRTGAEPVCCPRSYDCSSDANMSLDSRSLIPKVTGRTKSACTAGSSTNTIGSA